MAHTELPSDVLDYIELVERGRACKDQKALAAYIRRVFEQEALVVDLEQIGKYQNLVRYFPYGDLFPWQKFIRALWNCTYTKAGLPRWKTLLCMVGRGGGRLNCLPNRKMPTIQVHHAPKVHGKTEPNGHKKEDFLHRDRHNWTAVGKKHNALLKNCKIIQNFLIKES